VLDWVGRFLGLRRFELRAAWVGRGCGQRDEARAGAEVLPGFHEEADVGINSPPEKYR